MSKTASELTQPKAPWYQFTLREGLLLLTAAGCFLGLVGRDWLADRRTCPSSLAQALDGNAVFKAACQKAGLSYRLWSSGGDHSNSPRRLTHHWDFNFDAPGSDPGRVGYELHALVTQMLAEHDCRIVGTSTNGDAAKQLLNSFRLEYEQGNVAGWLFVECRETSQNRRHVSLVQVELGR
jgi:hypothetical protein